jgi:allophanate hydrolase subunit 2
LGSRATDLLSGLGPDPLHTGDVLLVGHDAGGLPPVDVAPRAPVGVGARETLTLRMLPGPRRDWFDDDAWHVLAGSTYVVSADSNRVGVRLDGPRLERAVAAELPSEGLVRGAVQVPPSGMPLVFLADHPTTGGYPVIAYVVDDDVDVIAQLRPGDRLRLRSVPG